MTDRYTRTPKSNEVEKVNCSGCNNAVSFLPFRIDGKPVCFGCKGRYDIKTRKQLSYTRMRDANVTTTSVQAPVATQKASEPAGGVKLQAQVESIFKDMV